MVDGFDSTLPLILQLAAAMFCLVAALAVGVCSQSDPVRRMLQVWKVLSGHSQLLTLQSPEFRPLQQMRCVQVPLRAGPPPVGYQIRCGEARSGDRSPQLFSPSN